MDTSAYTELFSGKLDEAKALVCGTGKILNLRSIIIVLQRIVVCDFFILFFARIKKLWHNVIKCMLLGLFQHLCALAQGRERDTAVRTWFHMRQDWGWHTPARFGVTVLYVGASFIHSVVFPFGGHSTDFTRGRPGFLALVLTFVPSFNCPFGLCTWFFPSATCLWSVWKQRFA